MKLLMVNDAITTTETMRQEVPWETCSIDTVYTAYNVAEGMAVISEHKIDILLCDIEMPGENGLYLIRWLREQQYDIDCILLTCHAEFAYAREAISLGCQDYIVIPASYEEICAAIAKVVARRSERLDRDKLQQYGQTWLAEKNRNMSSEQNMPKSPAEVVRSCACYIIDHLEDEDLNVTNIALHFYLNPIYLNRIFKRYQKITINQFIINEKMELAARLLRESDFTAQAIAIRTGYPNYSYFCTIFRKYYGCTPKEYREANI